MSIARALAARFPTPPPALRATSPASRWRTWAAGAPPLAGELSAKLTEGALRVLLAAFALLFSAVLAHAAPTFPPLTGRVVDDAHVLSAQAQQELTTELADLEAKTGRQVVVVTLPSLQGYAIEDYGYQLGRAWGIGQKGQNNGVLFIVAPSEHKVRIEVGYGLEPVLTDALSSVILQEQVLPKFRDGDVEGGVVAGTQAIVQQLSAPDADAKANVARAEQAPRAHANPVAFIFTALILFWLLSSVIGALGGRRGGGCSSFWLLPLIFSGGGFRGGGFGDGGGFGGGGFSGGGGSFGGGGASGSW